MSNDLAFSWDEYVSLDATGLASLVAKGEVSAHDLARQAAAAYDMVNPTINAGIELFADAVENPNHTGLNQAGAFHGVPVFLKDLGSRMRGRLQENGFSWQGNNVCQFDDPLTSNWREAGFNLIGRSATPESGMTHVTHTIKYGTTLNPWNLERTPGGSSGGASALIASGVVPIASGSDGGGSLRFPAAWTGLVGLKPTRGLCPLPFGYNEPMVPGGVEGMMSRTVRDTAATYDFLRKKTPGSGFMPFPEPTIPYLEEENAKPRKFRIALSVGAWSRTADVDPLIRDRVLDVARKLEGFGHVVEEVQDEAICDFEALFRSYTVAHWIAGQGQFIQMMAAQVGSVPTSENTTIQAMNHIEAALKLSPIEILEAAAANPVVTRQWGDFWQTGYDLMLTPVLPIQCPRADSLYRLDADLPFEEWLKNMVDSCRYTMPVNETGQAAISLPCGLDSEGCPIGFQVIAPWARENDLLHLAFQYERACPDFFNQLGSYSVASIDA